MKYKKDSGVSAIIATILMVAITVVLAGVLYVMIIGLGGGNTEEMTPLGSWQNVDSITNTSAKLAFGAFTKEVKPIDLRLFIYEDGNLSLMTTITIPLVGQDSPCTISDYNASAITGVYTDYAWQSNTMGAGDYIILNGLAPGKFYSIEILHLPSQSIVSMAGDNSNFQLPP